jgi:hypothetical protein
MHAAANWLIQMQPGQTPLSKSRKLRVVVDAGIVICSKRAILLSLHP